MALRADFIYGENKLDGVSGKTKLAGGLGNISYEFKTAGGVKPYVIGGLGVFNVKVAASGFGSASETKFAFAGGGGLKFKAGSDSHFYIESRYVSVRVVFDADVLSVEVADTGQGFDPTLVPPAELDQLIAERRNGGLGLTLIRAFMDEVTYKVGPDLRNELRMVKRIRRE